jgi:16S rRNA (uracil1498-N3)-methyltransferase
MTEPSRASEAEPEGPVGSARPVLGAGSGPHAFVDDIEHPVLAVDDRHHLARVLRVRDGDPMTVADGAGRWRSCRFGDDLELTGPVFDDPTPTPRITIAFALVKGERPELIIQKLTELGVDHIVPFIAGRSVARPDRDRQARQAVRWARVAREAAMQCRRSRLPEIAEVATFDAVQALPGAVAADRFGDPPSLDRPTVLIGPEGGWADDERAQFATTVGLGPTVLRAETACIAAAAVLGALRAGLVGPFGAWPGGPGHGGPPQSPAGTC